VDAGEIRSLADRRHAAVPTARVVVAYRSLRLRATGCKQATPADLTSRSVPIAALRNRQRRCTAVRTAELEPHDMSAVSGTPEDTRRPRHIDRVASRCDEAILLVLIRQFRILQLSLAGRPSEPLAEMTPVASRAGQRAADVVRTRCRNPHAEADQLVPGAQNPSVAVRCPRFDDDDDRRDRAQLGRQSVPVRLRELAVHVCRGGHVGPHIRYTGVAGHAPRPPLGRLQCR
jgi:hypothetical protein